MKYSFGNDYSVLVHEDYLEAITKYMSEENTPYGGDYHSENALELIRKVFNTNGDVYFLAGGTQTNMVGLSSILRDYEGIIACDTAHINVHETGAVEASGHKIYTVKNKDGKLDIDDIKNCLMENASYHSVKYKAVYISYPTETGSLYSKKELTEIYSYCQKMGLYLFIDGARLSVGLTSKYSDLEFSDIASLCDMFYIGGTKAGMLLGEALVVVNNELKKDFLYNIKNKGAMLAKGYLVGIEFERAFEDSLYFDLGFHANQMSYYLQDKLNKIGYKCKSETNQVFIKVKKEKALMLEEKYKAEVWNFDLEYPTMRLVTSFKTSKEDIDGLIDDLKI